jgi:hypothetical protein
MCNCRERIKKEIMDHNLYPSAIEINNLNIEMLSERSFSRMEAVYPVKNNRKHTKEFNMFHTFCPWCGEPYDQEIIEYKELTDAFVKMPIDIAMACKDVEVILVEISFATGTISFVQKINLSGFEENSEGKPYFCVQAGDDGGQIDPMGYGSHYFFMMARPEYMKQLQRKKERKLNG